MKPHEIAYKVASSHYDRKLRDFAKDLIIAYEESLRPNLRKDREPIAEVLDSYAIPLWQAS